ncbi:MAG: hypothetical protein KDA41_00850, partial [Planctomycetales bacterium]|nr:hypothetical protein [Planctomycetales bacterium]
MNRTTWHKAWAVGFALSLALAGGASAKDFNDADIRSIPVYHHGRVMPWDTLAKVAAETISEGGSYVKLQLEGYYTPDQLADDARLKPALEMFPEGKQRKVPASEMLLSWMIESEKWEEVPFILCEHAAVHEVLGLKSKTDGGLHRKYVSPRMIAESQSLVDYVESWRERRMSVESADEKFKPTPTDELVEKLLVRYRVYRKLTHDPRLPLRAAQTIMPGDRSEFLGVLSKALDRLDEQNAKGSNLEQMLATFVDLGQSQGLGEDLSSAARGELAALADLRLLASRMFPASAGPSGEAPPPQQPPTLAEAEAAVVQLRKASLRLVDVFEEQKNRAFEEGRMTEDQARTIRPMFHELTSKAGSLTVLARQMHLALYDNGATGDFFKERDQFRYNASVYVAPALNPAALAKNRDPMSEAEPWLTLKAVLYGSDDLLLSDAWPQESFDRGRIKAVRAAWKDLAAAYQNRGADGRAAAVETAAAALNKSLRQLGEDVEPKRERLVAAELSADQIDEHLLAYTAYPSAARLAPELAYNAVKPFQWAWVICFFSVLAFGQSFSKLRAAAF